MAIYVGIDVHKKYCQAALMNDSGRVLQGLRFDNNSEGTTSIVTLAKSVDPQIKAVLEKEARPTCLSEHGQIPRYNQLWV
jgi:hypothetical protein